MAINCNLEDEIQNLLLVALEGGTDVSELHAIVDHAKAYYEQALRERTEQQGLFGGAAGGGERRG